VGGRSNRLRAVVPRSTQLFRDARKLYLRTVRMKSRNGHSIVKALSRHRWTNMIVLSVAAHRRADVESLEAGRNSGYWICQ